MAKQISARLAFIALAASCVWYTPYATQAQPAPPAPDAAALSQDAGDTLATPGAMPEMDAPALPDVPEVGAPDAPTAPSVPQAPVMNSDKAPAVVTEKDMAQPKSAASDVSTTMPEIPGLPGEGGANMAPAAMPQAEGVPAVPAVNAMPAAPGVEENGQGGVPDAAVAPIGDAPQAVQPSQNINTAQSADEAAVYQELRRNLLQFLGKTEELPPPPQAAEKAAPSPAAAGGEVAQQPVGQVLPDAGELPSIDGMPGEKEAIVPQKAETQPTAQAAAPVAPAAPEKVKEAGEPATPQQQPIPPEAKKKQVAEKVPEPKAKKPIRYSPEDKAYLDYLDQAQKDLPENRQMPEKAKETLGKVTDKLAREVQEEKEKEAGKAQKYELSRGKDLSTVAPDKEGEVRSEKGFDLVVKDAMTPEKKEKFLSTEIQLDMGYRALMTGQLEAAIDVYKDVLKKHPDNEDAMFGLANAYQKNDQKEQAKKAYRDLLEAHPDHKEALNNFLLLMADDSPEDALLELRKLERINPEYSPVAAQIGMVYFKMKQYAQAERYLRKAISMSPDNLFYLHNLAIVSDYRGEKDQAIALYERLVKESREGKPIPGSVDQIQQRLKYLRSSS